MSLGYIGTSGGSHRGVVDIRASASQSPRYFQHGTQAPTEEENSDTETNRDKVSFCSSNLVHGAGDGVDQFLTNAVLKQLTRIYLDHTATERERLTSTEKNSLSISFLAVVPDKCGLHCKHSLGEHRDGVSASCQLESVFELSKVLQLIFLNLQKQPS